MGPAGVWNLETYVLLRHDYSSTFALQAKGAISRHKDIYKTKTSHLPPHPTPAPPQILQRLLSITRAWLNGCYMSWFSPESSPNPALPAVLQPY